ncbi:UDP-glucosyltransferase 2-like [Periplaneta americana]|uniref:UDP-glucosyltransferase 2-like n=1 Tax=Periplaneta americana TaxID=6978 RepID=UPI0037E74BE5
MFGRVNLACEKGLQSRGGQQLLNYPSTEPFDLIITEAGWGECFYGFIGKFGSPPVVAISAFGIPPWTSGFMGTSENPSYIPNFFTPYSSRMDFGQRILNFVMHNLVVFLYEYRHIPRQEAIARKYFKEDIPSFWRIERNFSIFLANILIGLDDPRPLSPNVIPIGGMHVKAQPDPLPQDLVKFLDEAKDGFIFFSLGSNLRSDAIAKDKLQVLLDAFSELPQRVLWKFESHSLLEQPSNVMIGKWLPQSDILAHPNIRLFISHCGRLSVIEAILRGVPIVGVPFFMDQMLNLQKCIARGVAVKLDFLTLTKESVLTAVKEVLNNHSYRINMNNLSALAKDQPETGLERAVFWVEYVIRHKGASHLRPAAVSLCWYQYLLLDVLLVFATGALLVVFLLYFVLRIIFRQLYIHFNRKPKTN